MDIRKNVDIRNSYRIKNYVFIRKIFESEFCGYMKNSFYLSSADIINIP